MEREKREELDGKVAQYLQRAGSGEVHQVRLSVGSAAYSEAEVRGALNRMVKDARVGLRASTGWKSGWAEQTRNGKEEKWWVDGYKPYTTYVALQEAA